MGTKISEFTTIDKSDVETNKEKLWFPTYCENPINNESNFKVKIADVISSGGSGGPGEKVVYDRLVDLSVAAMAPRPAQLLLDNVSYDVIYGYMTFTSVERAAIVPIFTGDEYKNNGYLKEAWSFAKYGSDNYNGLIVMSTYTNEKWIPLYFEAPAGKKIIAIGIKGEAYSWQAPLQNMRKLLFGINK